VGSAVLPGSACLTGAGQSPDTGTQLWTDSVPLGVGFIEGSLDTSSSG